MDRTQTHTDVPMYVASNCLVVPIQQELDDPGVARIREAMLQKVFNDRIKGVLIDVSAVTVLDRLLARALFDTARTASLLGAAAVICGLRPGVAAALAHLGFEPGDVVTALNMDEGLQLLAPASKPIGDAARPGRTASEEESEPADGSCDTVS